VGTVKTIVTNHSGKMFRSRVHKAAERNTAVRVDSDKLTETNSLTLSQTFCYWGKQQSAGNNIIQLHLTLKCTKDQYCHFCDCFLVSKWIFQHHDCGLTKFHAGSEQLQYWCVSSLTTPVTRPSKTTTQLIIHVGNIECRLEGI